jgi:hypothetical protein
MAAFTENKFNDNWIYILTKLKLCSLLRLTKAKWQWVHCPEEVHK